MAAELKARLGLLKLLEALPLLEQLEVAKLGARQLELGLVVLPQQLEMAAKLGARQLELELVVLLQQLEAVAKLGVWQLELELEVVVEIKIRSLEITHLEVVTEELLELELLVL
ncbi:MAG TPA: hypothetical protein VLE89_03975 [Chlamydiales bacterium]|nr:hypothetical protein [Chlamydiales bacterium]